MIRFKYRTRFVSMPDEMQPRTLLRANRGKGLGLAGDPYRTGVPTIGLHQFSQHVSIALELGYELATLRDRCERAVRWGNAEWAWSLSHEIGSRWEMAWSHLDDARALAVRDDRDVAAYDRARGVAGDLSSAVAIVEVGGWRPVEAVPEARIERQPEPPNVRLGRRLFWKWSLIAIVATAAIASAHFAWNLAQVR